MSETTNKAKLKALLALISKRNGPTIGHLDTWVGTSAERDEDVWAASVSVDAHSKPELTFAEWKKDGQPGIKKIILPNTEAVSFLAAGLNEYARRNQSQARKP